MGHHRNELAGNAEALHVVGKGVGKRPKKKRSRESPKGFLLPRASAAMWRCTRAQMSCRGRTS
jgi:hypothetical protein